MLARYRNPVFLALVLFTVTLAGCADSAPKSETELEGPPEVEATSTTGGIRGIIVDQTITPIAGVTVVLKEAEKSVETGADGVFLFNGLEPGFYSLEASKPLYDSVQATTEVKAGVKTPDAVKIQLTRLTDQDPYINTEVYEGYIFCSANVVIALSEECGEGVGVPGAGRIGGNPDNNAQIDFSIQSADAKTLIAEAVWEPSLSLAAGGSQSGGFNMGIYTDFSCDPFCGWAQQVDRKNGVSPLYLRSNHEEGYGGDVDFLTAGFNEDTKFSTFTWAAADETGVLIEQPFTVYVTSSYLLELPVDWSFVNGDANPF